MEKSLTIQVWSDVICPWCWIAETRLTRALAHSAFRSQVVVVHRAFRIKQGMAPQPVEAMLQQKFGPGVNPGQFLSQVEAAAAAEGLDYQLAGTLVGDTTEAQRLLKLAAGFGLQAHLLERLYRGYFSEHESMFDRGTLTRLAVESGLQRKAVEALFASDAFRDEVETDQHRAQQHNLSGVPYFLFDEKLSISGAQSQEVFSATLARAWNTESVVETQMPEGALCGPEGCALP